MKNKFICLLLLILIGFDGYARDYILTPTTKVLFEYSNIIQVETYNWPRTLITYRLSITGDVSENDLVFIDMKTGKDELFQLSNIKKDSSGKLVYADISFMAELPQAGRYQYQLSVENGRNKKKSDMLSISEFPSGIEIKGSKYQVRMPKSVNVNSNEALAPIISINQGTSWIGNNKIISPKKKIESIISKTIETGALFIEQSITYKFEGNAEYIAKVKLVKDYPFVIMDETMIGLSKEDNIKLEMAWTGFHPQKRFGTQWDRVLEGKDAWLDINKPIYTSYSKEDPHWTGMGWEEDPAKQMIYRISPFGGNSVREQTPVMSFWEESGNARELGVFVYDHNRWNDKQYGIWQPTPILSIYFRHTNDILYFTYPLVSGTRSTALSFFPKKEGEETVQNFKSKLATIAKKGGKHNPNDMFFRNSQLLLMQYASLSLDRIKDWDLTYSENAKRPENLFESTSNRSIDQFVNSIYTSPMAYYPMGLNYYPGIHSIEHRILYSNYVEDYLRFYKDLNKVQKQTIEALFIMAGYVNMLEEMNSIRNALGGTANMAADGWAVPQQIAYLFPEHSMAKEWSDYFEKQLEINGLFYTRPPVNEYESKGGRWVESLGIYNWAFLRPTSHSNIAGELFDGKNRFASDYMAARATWMRDMMTAPIKNNGRCFPPHGAHGGGLLVPRYAQFYQTAKWLENYNPLLAENLYWQGPEGKDVETKPTDSNWQSLYKQLHSTSSSGTNPHLKSSKYTGHGIVLRAGVDTPEELSIHLDQVDKGPNYRWGNQGDGNNGGLYFYANGKVYTAHENEIAGDHIVNNLDGLTNFGVMKNGDYRTIGMNELKAPLYNFGFAQFAELLSDNGKDKYVWPDYLSRSVMLAGTDYFILFDEVGTNWRAAERFSWFNRNGHDFPKITFLSSPARKDAWMTAQTPNARGFYRDNFGSVLTLITHKKDEVSVQGGKFANIPLLNNPDIAEFIPDKKNIFPSGVVNIKTANSSDMIFRNGDEINYVSANESFCGKAGLIRRFNNGQTEMSLFKGKSIIADDVGITIDGESEAALALTHQKKKDVKGILKTLRSVKVELTGLPQNGKLYANGVEVKTQMDNEKISASFPKGEYQLEYTRSKPTPMPSRILYTEYEKGRVKLLVESTSPCESVRIDTSNDGGKTWKKAGFVKSNVFYVSKDNNAKIHVRAVSMNGDCEATFAQEYPVYFTNEAPHYPEGLWLKLSNANVELKWGEVLGVQKYRLYRRTKEETYFKLIYEGRERKYSDVNLKGVLKAFAYPGTLDNSSSDKTNLIVYEYAVSAINGNGESAKSPIENTDPASWRNWYPDTELKFKRQSAFWMEPYVCPNMIPEKYYPN